MRRSLLLAVACVAGSLLGGAPTLRVMPLGDSITHGTPVAGGYRLPLYEMLTEAGYKVDMVGSATDNPAPGLGAEINHEGHSGWLISDAGIGIYEKIAGWLGSIDDPDVVLVHIGTNDSPRGGFETAPAKLDALLTRIAELRPYAHLVVTTLMKRNEAGNANNYNNILTHFNPYVEGIVEKHRQLGHRVHFLDMHARLDLDMETMDKTSMDFADGLHPNAQGYRKMAAAWFGAIQEIFPSSAGDASAPAMARAEVSQDATRIKVVFSKPVAAADVDAPARWTLRGPGAAPDLEKVEFADDCHSATLTFAGTIPAGKGYSLQVAQLQDLSPEARMAWKPSVDFDVFNWGYEANIDPAEWSGYQLVYKADLAASGGLVAPATVNALYTFDGSNASPAFDRVAYYLELRPAAGGDVQYVWVSMDAFTDDVKKIGVPYHAADFTWKTNVSNLHVFSNVEGVDCGTDIRQGALEFWPYSYNDPRDYDYDDVMTTGNYGSMQVHNLDAKKTIWAVNHFSDGGVLELGIGNCPTDNPTALGHDWTFARNGADWDVRRLYVLVRPVKDVTAPSVLSAKVGADGTQLLVRFNEDVLGGLLEPENFACGVPVSDLFVLDDRRTVSVRLARPIDPAGGTRVTVSGVRDLSLNACPPNEVTTEPMGIPEDVVARLGGTADLEGYQLIYATDFPAVGNFNSAPHPYWFEQVDGSIAIDRVAYFFELDGYAGDRNWVLTSFDSPSQYRRALGVPIAANNAAFQQKVSNAFVKSNVAALNLGHMGNGCNIEFWPFDYSTQNGAGVPNASDNDYDWGDRMTGWTPATQGFGSMQVHSWQNGLTLWSMTRFGRDGLTLGVGLGNNNNYRRDWTEANNAGNYWRRRLFVFVRPRAEGGEEGGDAPAALAADVKAEIASYVGEDVVQDYEVVAAARDFPAQLRMNDNAWAAQNFYTLDTRATVPVDGFDRVAYFMLTQTAGEDPKYVWTAMDAFTGMAARLGVPNGGYVFKSDVTNLDVASNVAGITNGNGFDTGCIEFWPSNYNTTSQKQQGASDLYDSDDAGYDGSTGHGSMQVHNWGSGEVLWAINNFNNGNSPGMGIGARPDAGNDPDWTFAANAAKYTRRCLYILVRRKAEAPVVDLKAEVEAKVGSPVLEGYQLLWSVTNIPQTCAIGSSPQWARENFYDTDNRFAYPLGSVQRVAYFMEVQYDDPARDTAPRYVLAVMDGFADDASQYGVPYGGYYHKTTVTNLDVYSNDPHVTTGTGIQTGNVEFWASDYGNNNTDLGGVAGQFDWDDDNFKTGSNGHGSMQIHNYGAHECLICFNAFNGNRVPGLGVGSNQYPTGNDLDYTHAANRAQYSVARFYCFVLPAEQMKTPNAGAPQATQARVSSDTLCVKISFDRALAANASGLATFDLGKGVRIARVARDGDTALSLSVAGLSAGGRYTLAYSGVKGVNGEDGEGTIDIVVPGGPSVTDMLSRVPEAGEYTLAYSIDLPETSAGVYRNTPYDVDESSFRALAFDRVAYGLELVSAEGAKWVWVSMDAFTSNVRNIAIPTADRGAYFAQKVANMNVYASANAGVTQGEGLATGRIEFAPSDYNNAPSDPEIGGGATYDFNDSGFGLAEGYGTMQVHNWGAGETLFALNNFGKASGGKLCLGIGNSSHADGHTDWTFMSNADTYSVRRLSVYVRELPSEQLEEDPNAPRIYVQPASVACRQDDAFVLSVVAGGATSYQWYFKGQEISGATGPFLNVLSASSQDAGDYKVAAVNAHGAAFSEPANVRVILPSTILFFR